MKRQHNAAVRRATQTLLAGAVAVGLAAAAEAQAVHINGHSLDDGGVEAALGDLGAARVAIVAGDDEADQETILAAGTRVILALEARGFEVLVLPIGFFEGAWVDAALDAPLPASLAPWPVYRVWQESPRFRELLEAVRSVRAAGGTLAVAGLLSRYHAIGKTLYAPHLLAALAAGGAPAPGTLASEIEELWAGPDRLARSSPEKRAAALALAEQVLAHVDTRQDDLMRGWGAERFALERHFLVNMRTFVQLEQLRGGDHEGDGTFADHEQEQNLEWLLGVGYPSRRLIVWEGRGSNGTAAPADAYRIRLTVEP